MDKKRTGEAAREIKALMDKLRVMSEQTWNGFYALPKEKGCEHIYASQMNPPFVNELLVPPKNGEKFLAVRFKGEKGRIIMRQGAPDSHESSNVAYVLGIDYDLVLYDHGN